MHRHDRKGRSGRLAFGDESSDQRKHVATSVAWKRREDPAREIRFGPHRGDPKREPGRALHPNFHEVRGDALGIEAEPRSNDDEVLEMHCVSRVEAALREVPDEVGI